MNYILQSDLEFEISITGEHEMLLVILWSPWCEKCPRFLDAIIKVEKDYPDIRFVAVEVEQLGILETPAIPSIILYSRKTKIYEGLALSNEEVLRKFLDSWRYISKSQQHPLLAPIKDKNDQLDIALQKASVKFESISKRLNSLSLNQFCSFSLKPLESNYINFRKILPKEMPGNNVRCIYTISAACSEFKIQALCSRIDELRKTKANFPRMNDNTGSTLYVGSSKNLRARLNQHLDKSISDTYALHLGRVADIIDFDIIIKWFIVPCEYIDISQEIEDALWMHLAPVFGRMGAR